MAKTYFESFLDSLEAHFQEGNYPIMALSGKNLNTKRIRFVSYGEYNDGTNEIPEYHIQRMKRIKEGDQQNTDPDKAGTDYINTLDQAKKIEWETIKTKRSTQKELLIYTKLGEATNALADATAYERTIATATENKLISKEERAVANIIKSIDAQGADHTIDITAQLTAATDRKEKYEVIASAFTLNANDIDRKVDDFAYNSKSVALYDPIIGNAFAKLEGQGYHQGTNTFGDSFKGGFNYADLDFLPEDVFKSVAAIGGAGDDTDKITLGIVMTPESYQDSGMEQGHIPVARDLIRKAVAGHIYDDLNIVVDPSRQVKVIASIASLKAAGLLSANFSVQKKVND